MAIDEYVLYYKKWTLEERWSKHEPKYEGCQKWWKGSGWLGSSSAGPSKRVDTKFGCSYHMCTPQQVLISLSFQEHGPTNTTKYIEKMESCKWSKTVHLKGYVSLGIQTTKCIDWNQIIFLSLITRIYISSIDSFINTKSRSTELASICFQISLELYLVS